MQNSYGKHQCPCCDFFTLEDRQENPFEICPVCFWENDGIQFHDPTYTGGANRVSLNEARENFKEYGAMEERFSGMVRQPVAEEL